MCAALSPAHRTSSEPESSTAPWSGPQAAVLRLFVFSLLLDRRLWSTTRGTHAGVCGFLGRLCSALGRAQELRGRGGDAELRGARRGEDGGGTEQLRGPGRNRLLGPLSVRGGRAAAPGRLLGPGAPGGSEQPERVHIVPVSPNPGLCVRVRVCVCACVCVCVHVVLQSCESEHLSGVFISVTLFRCW